MTIWQSFLGVTLTLLLSGLMTIIIVTFLTLSFGGESIYTILLKRKQIVYLVILLLFLAIPVAFSLPRGEFLSPQVAATYVIELLFSVMLVLMFSFAWGIINNPVAAKRAILSRWLLAELSLIAVIIKVTGSPKRLPYLFRRSMIRLRTLLEIWEQQPSVVDIRPTVRRLIDAIGLEQLNKEYLWFYDLLGAYRFEIFRQIGQSVGIILEDPHQSQEPSTNSGWEQSYHELWETLRDAWNSSANLQPQYIRHSTSMPEDLIEAQQQPKNFVEVEIMLQNSLSIAPEFAVVRIMETEHIL